MKQNNSQQEKAASKNSNGLLPAEWLRSGDRDSGDRNPGSSGEGEPGRNAHYKAAKVVSLLRSKPHLES